MTSVYNETDWMDLPQFIRQVADGRDPIDCSFEIRAAITRKIAMSPIFYIRNFLKTTTKDGELITQEPWLGQVMLDLCCESQRKRRVAQKIVEIKPRQVGYTQHNIARAFHRIMMPNMNALLLVKDEDVASDFMERIGTFYNGLPSWMRPMKRIDNPKLLNLDNPRAEQRADRPGLNSKFICTVPSGMRGLRPNYFIWSEAAFYGDKWKDVVEGPMSAMGASPAFCTILDTTPNGEDDFYFPLVMEAIERNPKWVAQWSRYGVPTRQQVIDGILGEPDKPKEGWVPVFLPWYWHTEYCLVAGTRVSTARGPLKIEDVRLNEKTTFGRVSKLWKFEQRETIVITLSSGRSIQCTPEHPIMTKNNGWVRAGELSTLDSVKISRPTFGRTVQYMGAIEVGEDFARLLGYYMADGCFRVAKGILVFACNVKDADVISDVARLLKKFIRNFSPRHGKNRPPGIRKHSSECVYIETARKDMVEFFVEHKLASMETKRRIVNVPEVIFRSPTRIVRQFLKGLFEGDGYADQRGLSICLHSKYQEFLKDVQILLHMFDIRSSIYKTKRSLNGKNHYGYQLHLRANESEGFIRHIGFVSMRKSGIIERRGRNRNNIHNRIGWGDFEKIASIEDGGIRDVYDITVPGSHAFVANGIVVHNCTTEEDPQGQIEPLTSQEKTEIKQTLGKKERYGGEEEVELVEKYGVALGRIAWRRWCIDNNTGGRDVYERLLTFRQEFCSDYKSAFRKIGKSTFDIRGMETLGRQVCPPVLRGKIRQREKDGALYVDQKFHSDWEEFRIWATPQSDEDYVVGVDGSNDWMAPDSDSWVAQVLRRRDRKQVAVYEMKCPPSVVRDNLYMLYLYYHRPLLGIEMEGSAIAVARELFIMGATRQYRWKRMDADPYKQPGMDYLGWETSMKTRPVMQNLLVEAIGNRDADDHPAPTIILRDEKTYNQLTECTRDEWGKIENHSGGHDDHAIALMIALAVNQDVWEAQRIKQEREPERQTNPLLEHVFGSSRGGFNRPKYESL